MSLLAPPICGRLAVALLLTALPVGAGPISGTAAAAPVAAATAGEVTRNAIRVQNPVVLYASHTSRNPLRVSFEADLVNRYPMRSEAHFSLQKYVGGAFQGDTHGVAKRVSGGATAGTYAGTIVLDKHVRTGRHLFSVEAFYDPPERDLDEDYIVYTDVDVLVKRNTMMPSFNASPEPVRKGAPIKVAGRLTKLWPDVGYVGYGGKTIDVYFKPVGGTWTLKGSATTDSTGCWSRSFTASEDGSWQARFKGTSNYHRETSHSDYVDVQ